MMKKLDNTQYFKIQSDQEIRVSEVLQLVYQAMTEKGYDPVNQIVGYIMSGDPTYHQPQRRKKPHYEGRAG